MGAGIDCVLAVRNRRRPAGRGRTPSRLPDAPRLALVVRNGVALILAIAKRIGFEDRVIGAGAWQLETTQKSHRDCLGEWDRHTTAI